MNAVANIQELFARAILGETEPDKNGNTQVKGVHKMYVNMSDKGDEYLVKLTVKEFLKDGNRIYSVEAIEENGTAPEMTASTKTHRLNSTTNNSVAEISDKFNTSEPSQGVEPQSNSKYSQSDIDYLNSIINKKRSFRSFVTPLTDVV